ncbi:MAG: hypothetical protein R3247_06705, partial [Rhodothermales bacterium]|nr:hypothetical protein [Rhodothermales bacterium]
APEADVQLSFGTLGSVQMGSAARAGTGTGTRQGAPGESSPARQVWESVDRPRGGAAWNAWWTTVGIWAMATGHRWIVREAPVFEAWWGRNRRGEGGRPLPLPEQHTRQDELDGFRPYLVEYSPLEAPDWHFDAHGTLQYIRFELQERVFKSESAGQGGTFSAAFEKKHLLMVRPGFEELGPEFSGGGWWRFDKDGELELGPDGEPVHGTWSSPGASPAGSAGTSPGGSVEIPCFAFFYQRESRGGRERPRMSRPGLTEIGQVAIAHMNLDSAADSDALESGSRRIYIAGGTASSHNEAVKQLRENSRIVTIPGDGRTQPRIHDTGSVSAATAIGARQEKKRDQAMLIAAEEAAWRPESSAESKEAGYRDTKSPRLALFAEEIEAAQTQAIHLLEEGWGAARPSGFARWPKDFDLLPLVADIMEAFEVLRLAGAESPSLQVHLVMSHLRQKGLLAGKEDAEIAAIEEELLEGLQRRQGAEERARDLTRSYLQRRRPLPTDDPPTDDPSDEEE